MFLTSVGFAAPAHAGCAFVASGDLQIAMDFYEGPKRNLTIGTKHVKHCFTLGGGGTRTRKYLFSAEKRGETAWEGAVN